jgi:histidinol-phosphatase (PHP family)
MNEFLKNNYHTHTYRCQHASGTEEEFIEAAIEMGIQTLGFSDHVPCPFKNGYISRIRMTMQQAPEYVGTLRRLAAKYKDDIRILVGFEAEYIPEFYEEQMRLFRNLGCEYLIMGQHFWQSEDKGPYAGSLTDDESRIRDYVDSVIEGMKTGSYRYLAHPDLINYQGMDSVYEWEMTRLCRELKELDIPLEINILGMGEGARHYPAERFWKIAGEIGNNVILGLDAHSVRQLRDVESYRKCKELIKKYNLNLINKLEDL